MEQNKKIVGLEMNLDQEYLKGAVEDIVKAGIVQALGDPSEMIKLAIDKIINIKVDSDGKPNNSAWNAKPYLQYVAEQTVKNTVKECLEKYIEENRTGFEEEIKKQLGSKKFRTDAAAAFVETMLRESQSHYRMPITVTFEADKGNY